MKNTMKRLLVTLLALMMITSVMLPAAMASGQIVSNAATTTTSIYAGMKTTLAVKNIYGTVQKSSLFTWKSSKPSVVKVTSGGVITGMKAGTATITATRKSNKKDKCSMKVTVKRNKVDNIYAKPSASRVSYKNAAILLKSVEIVSPTKVVAEYYVAFNFPSSWKATKINYVSDAINLYSRSTGYFTKTIVGGKYQVNSKSISGFKTRKGKFVQTIKVTYSGSQVNAANIRLSNYLIADSKNVQFGYRYYK